MDSRKTSFFLFGCVVACALGGPATAQSEEPSKPTSEKSWGWPFFERPESKLEWTLREKPPVHFEIGGSIREQFEGYRNFELGVDDTAEAWDTYLLHRLLVHADLVVDDRVRLFAEFGNSIIVGNERPASPVDEDDAYVHQAFGEVAVRGRLGAPETVRVRVGRQELSFGSGRLVSLRDGPNLRRSFDAARASVHEESFDADLFFGAEVQARPRAFDNHVDDEVLFWGGYATLYDIGGAGNVDLYYLGLDRQGATFDVGTATETRHSLGARFWGRADSVDFNFEPVVQFGDFGDREIFAWTLGTDTGVTLGDGDDAPRIGLRANAISGGHSSGRLNTFNALFPNNSYFSEAALFAPANLIDVNPAISVSPSEDVRLTAMWDHLWRFDDDDAVYVPPGIPAIAGDQASGSYIGHSVSVLAEWEATDRTKLFGALTNFEAGPAVESAGGEDVFYFLMGINLSF